MALICSYLEKPRMKKWMLLALASLVCCNNTGVEPTKDYRGKHAEALAFCTRYSFNTDYYFLIDMSIHSGKNRFFICDLKTNKITDRKLVTHGSCDALQPNTQKWEKASFSNIRDSHCTAKGKYRIGKRDYSSWGIKVKYWLHGLEPTNSNAEQRIVVLHSWSAVAADEIFPGYTPLSWGCPAVSDDFMRQLDAKLQATPKPVLLWITD